MATKIVKNLYVNNVTMGAKSVDEAHQLFTVKEYFQKGINEFTCNSQEFLDSLPDGQKIKECVVKLFGMQ